MQDCYPKWVYHKTESSKVVQSKEEHEAIGDDWSEVPFEAQESEVSEILASVEIESTLDITKPKKGKK